MRAPCRGLSVAEMLIVLALFFGLLSLVATFMVRGKGIAVRTESLSSVQQEAVRLTRGLSQDLNRGTLLNGGQWDIGSLIFLSSKPVDRAVEPELEFSATNGAVVWKQWVGYYLDPASHEVKRITQALGAPESDPMNVPAGLLLTDLPGLAPQGRTIARQIVEFEPTGKASEDMMEFRVRARGEVPLGNLSKKEKNVEVELYTTIRMGTVVTP